MILCALWGISSTYAFLFLAPHSALLKFLFVEKMQGSAVGSIQQVHKVSMISKSIWQIQAFIDRYHPAFLVGSSNGAKSKVAITWLWKWLDDIRMNSKLLWSRIVGVCTKALVVSGLNVPFQLNSFELFGFDLMFDQNLKCWLIEINSLPSLSCQTKLDVGINGNLIGDTIALFDPPLVNNKALASICTRQLSPKKGTLKDFWRIFNNRIPRVYGEMPKSFSCFPIHQNLHQHATMWLTRNWKKRKKASIIKMSIIPTTAITPPALHD